MGMVFQEPMSALNPVQTIGAQVAEALRLDPKTARQRPKTGRPWAGLAGARTRALPLSA